MCPRKKRGAHYELDGKWIRQSGLCGEKSNVWMGRGFVGEYLHYILGWGKMGKEKTNKTVWSDWMGGDGREVSSGVS